MRTATLAKLALTATVGIGALLGQTSMASAGPGPQQGTVKLAPTTTTIKPLVADPVDHCDLHLCLPADEVDPDDEPCGIIDCLPAEELEPQDIPKGPDDKDGPDQGCELTHGCPEDEDPCKNDHAARSECCEDRPGGGAPRTAQDECEGGTDGTTDGGTDGTDGTDGTTTDGGTDGTTDGGTDGTTDGGTDGGTDGPGGRLPKTGVELLGLVGLGAGGLGLGALLKRFGRQPKEQ